MPALSSKRLRTYFLVSIVTGILYAFLNRDSNSTYQIIDGLFAAGVLPMVAGLFLLSKSMDAFDLKAYAKDKLNKRSNPASDSDSSYCSGAKEKAEPDTAPLPKKESAPSFREPLLVGAIFCLASIFSSMILL